MIYGLIIGGILGFILSGGRIYIAILGAIIGYSFGRSLQTRFGKRPPSDFTAPDNVYSEMFREHDYFAPHDFFSSLMVLTAYVVARLCTAKWNTCAAFFAPTLANVG